MEQKTYPLSIWGWEGVYWASWGHHDPATFARALEADWDIKVPASKVTQGYARVGFSGEDYPARCVYNVKGPGKGVRPITEVEV